MISTMEGIKTAVKTDWKNLAHGNTRHYDFRIGEPNLTISGFKAGDILKLSMTVRWRFAVERIGSVVGCTNGSDYPLALWLKGDDDKDNVARPLLTWTATKDTPLWIYSAKWKGQYDTKKDENSYVIIENVMVSKDKPLPYIDSDELKAAGGVIGRTLIVALVLSEERRAA